jgi:hypothetical protein
MVCRSRDQGKEWRCCCNLRRIGVSCKEISGECPGWLSIGLRATQEHGKQCTRSHFDWMIEECTSTIKSGMRGVYQGKPI